MHFFTCWTLFISRISRTCLYKGLDDWNRQPNSDLAQLAERETDDLEVVDSIPSRDNFWWLVRLTLMVDWLFLPQNFGPMSRSPWRDRRQDREQDNGQDREQDRGQDMERDRGRDRERDDPHDETFTPWYFLFCSPPSILQDPATIYRKTRLGAFSASLASSKLHAQQVDKLFEMIDICCKM